ncbi:hypothetical protein ALP77_04384, partial [Pseudomonas amygdali pv. tabaci]
MLGQPGGGCAVLGVNDLQVEHDRLQVQQLCWTGGIDKQLERVYADMCRPELKIALRVTYLLQQCVSAWQMLLKILTRAGQIDFAPPFVA